MSSSVKRFRGLDGWAWAHFFARWVLGLTFLMAGWWKVVELGAVEHARRFFVEGYAESWIPEWLLWTLGTLVPWVELVAGALLCAGLLVRPALVALGGLLVIVTYGHLLAEPLFSLAGHVFVRLTLVLFLLAAPAERDRLGLDRLLRRRGHARREG